MTVMQLNAEIYESLSIIANDESLLRKAAKSLKRLASQFEDPTLMTKDEFFAVVDKSLEEAKEGKVKRIATPAELSAFLESL